jgi:hypothetical protein
MIEYMTNEEYKTYARLQGKFITCLEQCAIEISLMEHKREPKGEFCAEYELFDGDKYMVQFESHHCGDSDYDTVYVPIMYMYDEGYREYYGRHLESMIRVKEEARELRKQRERNAIIVDTEVRDRAEYERLKIKYDVVNTLEESK